MKLCRICGKPEEDHHEPEYVETPKGCVCDPLTWGPTIPPVCQEYKGSGGEQCCPVCGHEKGCHTPSLVDTGP